MASGLVATVEGLEEFLALSALDSQPLHETVSGFVHRAQDGGLSIARMLIGWRLLDPLYMSQTLVWAADTGVLTERFRHGEAGASPAYLGSPIHHLLSTEETEIRRLLDGPNAPFDFEMLEDLRARGFTDYLISKVTFGTLHTDRPGGGCIVSFTSDRPGGFREDELKALRRLKHMVGLAVRTAMEEDMRATLATTYLGRSAGQKVLSGQIARGEGEAIEAVIWYCDLRGSTGLCERMGVAAYLPLLNDYFSAMGEPVIAHGGQILDFIGDAVLAIFPLEGDAVARAQRAAAEALGNLPALRAQHPILADRMAAADITGIAIATGTVAYGNIGIPTRLTFSVIGPTVNEVARIERLTKGLHQPVLVTEAIARVAPERWQACGRHRLDGVAEAAELYALAGDAGRPGSGPSLA